MDNQEYLPSYELLTNLMLYHSIYSFFASWNRVIPPWCLTDKPDTHHISEDDPRYDDLSDLEAPDYRDIDYIETDYGSDLYTTESQDYHSSTESQERSVLTTDSSATSASDLSATDPSTSFMPHLSIDSSSHVETGYKVDDLSVTNMETDATREFNSPLSQCTELTIGLADLGMYCKCDLPTIFEPKKIFYSRNKDHYNACKIGRPISEYDESQLVDLCKSKETSKYKCKVKSINCLPVDELKIWGKKGTSTINDNFGNTYILLDTLEVVIFSAEERGQEYNLYRIHVLYNYSESGQSLCIVLFPVGKTASLTLNQRKEIVSRLKIHIDTSSHIILGGHSMGSAWAQQVGHCLALDSRVGKSLLDKIYIVGSGSFKWATPTEKDYFEKCYEGRYIFIGCHYEDIGRGDSYLNRERPLHEGGAAVHLKTLLLPAKKLTDNIPQLVGIGTHESGIQEHPDILHSWLFMKGYELPNGVRHKGYYSLIENWVTAFSPITPTR